MGRPPQLDRIAVLRARAHSLLLTDDEPARSCAQVVRWFAALQGQDMASVVWSLGVRTGLDRDAVTEAFETAQVVRTWPMRGTLHVVPGADARWMVHHLGRRSLAGAAARRAALGLDGEAVTRATDALVRALDGTDLLTRRAALAAMDEAGVATSGQRGYHLLWHAASLGLICLGPPSGREQTVALLDSWAPPGPQPDRDEALRTVAHRFVRSHGPVTVHDLARWADLTVTDARTAIASVEGLEQAEHDGRALWLTAAALGAAHDEVPVPDRALPGFDEFVLGYRDRTAQLPGRDEARVVPGGNGVFANTLVVAGTVQGTWRRRELSRVVAITAFPFRRLRASARRSLTRELERYAAHVGRAAQITWEEPS